MVGLFTVINKWLLVAETPALTAGAWTYMAAGVTLLPWAIKAGGLRFRRPVVFAAWILAGSVVGPSLYFIGLGLTSGMQGVLMINMEAVFTAFIAFVLFREKIRSGTVAASLAIVAGGIWISWPPSGASLLAGNTLGNLLIALGYLGWAIENNLGRLLSEDTPTATLVCVKAVAAGIVLGILASLFKQELAIPWLVVPGVVMSGSVSLGLSLALFYSAMRHIGAVRTGLISSTSVLWGLMGSFLLLGESLSHNTLIGGGLMLAGIAGFALEAAHSSQGDRARQ